MKLGTRHPIWNWVIHTPWVLAVIALLAVVIFFGSGAGSPLVSRLLVSRLEQMTGGKVEFRALSIQWFAMRATIKNLVIHGREPAGTEPLFTAEEVQAELCIHSLHGPRAYLYELAVPRHRLPIPPDNKGPPDAPDTHPAVSLHDTRP